MFFPNSAQLEKLTKHNLKNVKAIYRLMEKCLIGRVTYALHDKNWVPYSGINYQIVKQNSGYQELMFFWSEDSFEIVPLARNLKVWHHSLSKKVFSYLVKLIKEIADPNLH